MWVHDSLDIVYRSELIMKNTYKKKELIVKKKFHIWMWEYFKIDFNRRKAIPESFSPPLFYFGVVGVGEELKGLREI
jgi:hypothetical protein